MIVSALFCIILIILVYTYFLTKKDNDCVCFTDYVNLYNSVDLIDDLVHLRQGNWNNDDFEMRGIGKSRVAYNPGDDVYVIVNGSDDFKNVVKTTIQKFAQPYINLNFKFTTDKTRAGYIISSGTPPPGYTGWAQNIGGKKVIITLGNQRQMNILHELGHALGMVHENTNQTNIPRALASEIKTTYGNIVGNDILSNAYAPNTATPSDTGKNATPFDIKSIMGVSGDGFKTQRTNEFSEGDKLWLAKTYGKPGSGKAGKREW